MKRPYAVFMGNSIFESWSKMDSLFFFENNFLNKGISGQTSAEMLLRFNEDVVSFKPEFVVILSGTNDIAGNRGYTTLKQIENNIKHMCELATQNNIKVMLCSVLPVLNYKWAPNVEPVEKIIALNKWIKQYCIKYNIFHVEFYDQLVDADFSFNKKYTEDGVHPNAYGYDKMKPIILSSFKLSTHN
jgi:lysophospholipase L1-like esterase